jgi:hypothetical protein
MERRIVSSLRVRASFVTLLAATLALLLAGSAAAQTPTPTATATPPPAATPESGLLPESEGDGVGGPAVPAVSPDPAVTPVPSAAPTAAPPAATPPPAAPAATPTPVVTHQGHRSLAIPALILVLAVLGALALALSALAGRRSPGVRHAWREAAFRTRGTWADFSDWLRLGR